MKETTETLHTITMVTMLTTTQPIKYRNQLYLHVQHIVNNINNNIEYNVQLHTTAVRQQLEQHIDTNSVHCATTASQLRKMLQHNALCKNKDNSTTTLYNSTVQPLYNSTVHCAAQQHGTTTLCTAPHTVQQHCTEQFATTHNRSKYVGLLLFIILFLLFFTSRGALPVKTATIFVSNGM